MAQGNEGEDTAVGQRHPPKPVGVTAHGGSCRGPVTSPITSQRQRRCWATSTGIHESGSLESHSLPSQRDFSGSLCLNPVMATGAILS